jgi:hypothetical protein
MIYKDMTDEQLLAFCDNFTHSDLWNAGLAELARRFKDKCELLAKMQLGFEDGMSKNDALVDENATLRRSLSEAYEVLRQIHVVGFERVINDFDGIKADSTVWNLCVPAGTFKARSIKELREELNSIVLTAQKARGE